MKNLSDLGVQEMNMEEMMTIDGGGWIDNFFGKLGGTLQKVHDWIQDNIGIDIEIGGRG